MSGDSIKAFKQHSIINHSCPDVGEQEISEVIACLRSLQLKGGARVSELERQIASDMQYAGAVAVTTGGHAIHLALRVLFGGKAAVVGLPSYVCRSVYDAIVLAGCQPYLLDIDPEYYCVSVMQAKNASLDAVIVPHMFGIRAPIEDFLSAGLLVIEDCAQRLTPHDIALTEPMAQVRILSFEATKLITCGEGGMLLFDDPALVKRARDLRDGPYEFAEPALHLPMTDLQAAIALIQWKRLPSFLEKRSRLAKYYLNALSKDFPECVVPAMKAADTYHFRFIISVDYSQRLLHKGSERNVVLRQPVAPCPLHQLFGLKDSFPVTEDVFSRLVSIPFYPRLTEEEAAAVVDTVRQLLCIK